MPPGELGAAQEQFDTILSYLARGIPVAIGRVHSMAAVGYRYDPAWDGGGYLILRNSYGLMMNEKGYKRESFASIINTVNDAAEFRDGSIDDVRICRRALPQSDIQAIIDGKPVPDYDAIR